MAHEIRAPLASMRWYSEMLLDGTIGTISDEQKKLLTQIYESNKRIGGLIDNLLEIVHTENGKYVLKPEQVDVVAMAYEFISKNKSLIEEKKIELKTNFSTEKILFSFDKKSLELILKTLLMNAIKYNKENGTVDLNISNDKNFITIKVTDTGLGIKDEDKAMIGTEMFRSGEIKDKIEGTGLSLLLIKKVLALTGGELSFESALGTGSTFIVKLPIK